MATYTLDATVHETLDIPLRDVTLGRYDGNTKEADLTPVYVDGGYNARNYTAKDTLADATGRKWRWTATDIYGNTGSATVPEDRIQVSTDIVTCEDARIVWDIDGTTVTNATVTISQNGTTVASFNASGVEGKHILGGGLEPETAYTIVMAATVDGVNLTGTGTFTTEACTYNYFYIKNIGSSSKSFGLSNRTGNTHPSLDISLDGTTWQSWNGGNITVSAGGKIYIRGNSGYFSTSSSVNYFSFASSSTFEIGGDGNFLLSNYGGLIETPDWCFAQMFETNNGTANTAVTLNNLIFSGKVLTGTNTFFETFYYCSNVTQCPKFHVVENNSGNNLNFFRTLGMTGITSFDPFINMPTHLDMRRMASNTPVTTAIIRMDNAHSDALRETFYSCGNLTTVTMHIGTVGISSFNKTFYSCANLNSITLASDCGDFPSGFAVEENWLMYVSSTGTLHKPTATQFPGNALPVGWTISNDVTA